MKKILLVFFCGFFLVACGKKSTPEHEAHMVKAKKEALRKSLYFSGSIAPNEITLVATPAAGIVDELLVSYGQSVKKGDPLVVLRSDTFWHDFSTALTAYLKAKDQYAQSKTKLENANVLFKDGLISQNEISSTKSTYYGNHLALLEAEESLNKLMQTSGVDMDISQLDIRHTDEINQLLDTHTHAQVLRVSAGADGMILLPPSMTEADKLHTNTSVKTENPLLAIGDMSSFTVDIEVGELDINALSVGLPATITTLALPNHSLQGSVVSVGNQADTKHSGNPVFVCKVRISNLTENERTHLRVGMSAKVRIDIKKAEGIVVPIRAVHLEGGHPIVTVKRAGEVKNIPIKTGETNQNTVVVTRGLKPGDDIVIN